MNEQTTVTAPRLARLDPARYALADDTLARLMTPALVIYEQRVRDNVARMLEYMDGKPARWRPHLKTTKTPEIWAWLVEAGIRHFKCATVREARCLLELLQDMHVRDADLLIAYPLQGPSLARAGEFAREFANTVLSVLSEDVAHAKSVPEGVGIFVDVNPGMHRTGIPCADAAHIEAVAQAAGARFRGVHFYDGHIHDATASARRASAHANYEDLLVLLDHLRGAGIDIGEIITSGTPAFRYALDFPGFGGGTLPGSGILHRVSPGTVVFHDFQYDELLEDVDLEPAAVVVSRVVSHPRDGIVTCDAGSKSIAAEAGDPVAFVIGRPDLVARKPSEEHLPLATGSATAPAQGAPAQGGDGRGAARGRPALGDALYLVPRHVCPTVNLAEQALLVHADGTVSVVQVAGRAHELLADAAE